MGDIGLRHHLAEMTMTRFTIHVRTQKKIITGTIIAYSDAINDGGPLVPVVPVALPIIEVVFVSKKVVELS